MQALGGVAVLADSTYAAFQGKKKLKVEWEKSEHSVWTSDAYRKELEATSLKPCKVVRENGNVDAQFATGKWRRGLRHRAHKAPRKQLPGRWESKRKM